MEGRTNAHMNGQMQRLKKRGRLKTQILTEFLLKPIDNCLIPAYFKTVDTLIMVNSGRTKVKIYFRR